MSSDAQINIFFQSISKYFELRKERDQLKKEIIIAQLNGADEAEVDYLNSKLEAINISMDIYANSIDIQKK